MRRVMASVAVAALVTMTLAAGSAGYALQGQRSSYIVVLKPGTPNVATVADGLARAAGGEVGFVYSHALQGFSIQVSPQGAAALARNPQVAYVEADSIQSIEAQDTPTGIERIFAAGEKADGTPWNPEIDIDGIDDFRVDVDVAVIDTGVDYQHPDLNVVGGVNCASGGPFGGNCSPGGDDDHYHGTHVAGTIGALDNGFGVVGVAPGARIWAVKVLNQRGSGYLSWIVAGIDWVAANADTIEVANMSLGGSGYSQAEYDAIQGAVDAGVAFAVAAGNSDADANNYSPAAFSNVLTVSALADFNGQPGGLAPATCRSDVDDTLANFSNWGSAVDIAAPGVCILSTFPLEQGEYGTISGTSMASPHVAGALALRASVPRLDGTDPGDHVASLYNSVKSAGNLSWTDDSGDGFKERLLDVSNGTVFNPVLVAGTVTDSGGGGGGSGETGTNEPPRASFTFECTYLTCDFTDASTDDVGVTGWSWNFGDGSESIAPNPSHTYTASGTYTVTLTVTDNELVASARFQQSVTVSSPSGLTWTAANDGKTWTATVFGATGGDWTVDGVVEQASCETSPCNLTRSGIPKKVSFVMFTDTSKGTVTILKP